MKSKPWPNYRRTRLRASGGVQSPIMAAYCRMLCWLMDHTNPNGRTFRAVVWIAEATTPPDY